MRFIGGRPSSAHALLPDVLAPTYNGETSIQDTFYNGHAIYLQECLHFFLHINMGFRMNRSRQKESKTLTAKKLQQNSFLVTTSPKRETFRYLHSRAKNRNRRGTCHNTNWLSIDVLKPQGGVCFTGEVTFHCTEPRRS